MRRSMILSINFFTRLAVVLFTGLILLSSCTAKNEPLSPVNDDSPSGGSGFAVAVLPLANLSGMPAPVKEIRQSLIDSFKARGLSLVGKEDIEKVIVRHRMRYTGGVDEATARALRQEAGAEAVLITTLELYSVRRPPKIAMTSRLVSTESPPQILWMSGAGMAGDDSPGLLELGLVTDSRALLDNAVQQLANSLAGFLSGQMEGAETLRARKKFRPKALYLSPILGPGMKYKVVVVPLFNLSERKHGGDILALHFVRLLFAIENFQVVEPGLVRQELLKMRIIMDDGLSLGNADLIFSKLNADLVLTGITMDYQDYEGISGKPKVDFSAQLFERRSREVVWNVKSFNHGDDGVLLFDWGRVNTANAMAGQMVQLAVEDLVE